MLIPVQVTEGKCRRKTEEVAGPWTSSTELNFECSWYSTVLTVLQSRDYSCTYFTDGTKVQRSQNLAWGHTANKCSKLGRLRFRKVQSEGTCGALSTVLMPPLLQAPRPLHHPHLPNTEATQVRGQPLTSPYVSLDPPGKNKHHGRPGARMPGSDVSLPLPSQVAIREPQFTPYQKWEST